MGGLLEKTVSRNVARRVRARPRLMSLPDHSYDEMEQIKYANIDLTVNPNMTEMFYNFPKQEMNHHLVQVKKAKIRRHNRQRRITVRCIVEQNQGQEKKSLAA